MTKLADLDLLKFGHTIQLVGAVYSGDGRAFLTLFPEEQGDTLPEIEKLDMDPAEWEMFLRQTDILETEVTARATDGTVKKAIVRKSSRQIDSAVSWRVFKRDGYRCRYCGNDNTPLTVDHLVCWEEGGPSTEANLLSSCKKCNRVRGNTRYEDWLNHPHYLRVSKGLSEVTRAANVHIAASLSTIPRSNYIKSR